MDRTRTLEIVPSISDIVEAAMRQNFATLPLKLAVGELENLSLEEIRGYLVASDVINNPLKLREVVEASLTLIGDEEYSSIIATLMPEEITSIIKVSPEIFSEDVFHLIHPSDYGNSAMWEMISREQYEAIMIAGDQRVIRRLINFSPEAWTAKGRRDGPWGLFREDVEIFPEVVAAYFSAIINSPRDEKWKEAAIRAIGMDLLAYSIGFDPEIQNICLRLFPEIATNLSALRARGTTKEDAAASYRDTMENLQKELRGKNNIEEDEDDLAGMLAELRSMGVEKPDAVAVKTLMETRSIDNMLKEGIPDDLQF